MTGGAVALPTPAFSREPGWIYSKRWDLSVLILSAVLVPAPLLFALAAQRAGVPMPRAIEWVNIGVAGLIGGPHLFSTFTLTLLDRRFLARHRYYAAGAVLLPFAVLYFGIYHYALLIQAFFAWASLHVLHQILYLSDCYRARLGAAEARWSRPLDYAVVLSGLYPLGLAKIARGEFRVGGVVLAYPDWARPLHLPEAAAVTFALFLAAWIAKTAGEYRTGRMSVPKTALIAITVVVSILLPLGSNLDVLFQGYNTWHSFQYLFLFWFINRLRYARGEIDSRLVRSIVCRGRVLPYYAAFLAATAVLVLITLVVKAATPLSADQSYFVVVLSVLLIHYYFDHFLFTQTELVRA